MDGRRLLVLSWDQSRLYERTGAGWGAPVATFARGFSGAMQGTTVVIGDPDANDLEGLAYVYELRDGQWMQTATLAGEPPAFGSQFLFAEHVGVHDNGRTVVASNFFTASFRSAAFVYSKDGTGWTLSERLTIPETGSIGDMATDGDRIAFEVGEGGGVGPTVHIFRRGQTGWIREQRMTLGSVFGVALEGNLLAVGTHNPAEVLLYTHSDGTWTHTTTLPANPGLQRERTSIGGGLILVSNLLFGNSSQVGGRLTVNLGTLASGEQRNIMISGAAGAGFTGDVAVAGTATVGGGAIDPVLSNNSSTATIAVTDTANTCSDFTGPVVRPTVTGIRGSTGWYTSPVHVAWSVEDVESPGTVVRGPGCDATDLTADTTGTVLACSATSAGGQTSVPITVRIDRTPPTIVPVTEELGEGSYRLQFACADDTSGVADCPEPITVSAGAIIPATATDLAGNRREILVGLPRASAGADQMVEVGEHCTALVRLDGSGSLNPIGGGLTYTWTGPFGTASGQTPDVTLPAGQHSVRLTVRNASGVSSVDTVMISVRSTAPPVITDVPASIVVHQTSAGTPPVGFDPQPTATSACGPVTLTRDAPAEFLPGDTTVTFTAVDGAGNTARAYTVVTVVPRIDLAVTQSFVGAVVAGANAVYRVTLSNAGPAIASPVVAYPVLPPDVGLVPLDTGEQICSAPDGETESCEPIMALSLDVMCAMDEGTLTCRAGALDPGESLSFDLLVAVSPARVGPLEAQVSVSAGQQDLNEADNATGGAFPILRRATLGVAHAFATTSVVAGGAGEYAISVANAGPSSATNVRLASVLPEGWRVTSLPPGCTTTPGLLTCDRPALGANESADFGAIRFEIDPALDPGPRVLTTTASADETETPGETASTLQVEVRVDAALAIPAPPLPAVAGRAFDVEVHVSNAGPSTTRGATLSLTVPSSAGEFAPAGGCTLSSPGAPVSAIECPLASIGPGESAAVRVQLVPPPSARGALSIDAHVAAPYDVDASNNGAAVSVPIVAHANLRLAMTGVPDVVIAGERVTYTAHLTNHGPSDATGAQVALPLPAGATFVSGADCALVDASIQCGAGRMAPGAARQFTIVLAIDQFARGRIAATASASSGAGDPNEIDPDPSDNTAMVETPIEAIADLSVTVTAAPDPTVVAGTSLTYTIEVTNAGPSGAIDVIIQNLLPPELHVIGGDCVYGTPVTCRIDRLPVGDTATRTIEVEVDQFARGSIANTVKVSSAEEDPDGGNNAATVETAIEAITDLLLTLTADPNPVVAGTSLRYLVQVTNAGPSGATALAVRQTLPPGVTFVSGCAEAGGTATCTLERLARETSARLSVLVDVDPFTRGTLTSTATVAGAQDERDPDPGTNTHAIDTAVIARTDLRISMTGRPDPVVAGTFLRYAIEIVNDGPSGATEVTVTDPLPAGVLYVPAHSTSGCVRAAGVVTCPVADLAPGAAARLTVAVVPSAAGRLVNTATVAGAGDEEDPDPANNTAAVETSVASPAGGPAGAGDFNGDGHLDLAVVDENHDRVKIFLNDGHGNFSEHARVAVGQKPKAVAVGDLTGDGHLDLAVVNWVSDDVSILAGNGAGGFVEVGRPGVTGLRPAAVTVGDLNGDGHLDVAVAAELSDSVSILINDGTGSLVEARSVALTGWPGRSGPVLHPSAIATGDFDGDGTLDLAVANRVANSISVLLNTGAGGFAVAQTVALPGAPVAQPLALAVGDYDGDGTLDLAAANSVANTVAVLLNDGTGGFAEATPRTGVGQRPVAAAAGDVSGDGALDLIVANRNDGTVSVLMNDGAGAFPAAFVQTVEAGRTPVAVIVGDFDGDGDLDVVTVGWPDLVVSFLPNTSQ
ncbi:MAG TPA: FG-GAP-like repeat-containing protein [Vicinamibacterales bacterium]|nr:FG-GAP-like repeat-containing protein [Vicinamibacterales bacterium]